MRKGLSIYLDLIRFLAALSVFLFHMGYGLFSGHPFFGAFEQYGTISVMIFFVLSGFVIAFVRYTKEKTLREYSISRLSRIYSVAAPALLIVAICDSIGVHLRPDLYSNPLTWVNFFRDLTFTNMTSGAATTFGTAAPFWSLGFEVPYYVLFGIITLTSGTFRPLLALAVAYYFGPHVLLLLPTWLLGCLCFALVRRIKPGANLNGTVAFFATLVIFAFSIRLKFWTPISHGINFDTQSIFICYAMAVLFGVHLIGAHMASDWLEKILTPFGPLIRWLAGGSFSLYVLHVPFAFFLRALLPKDLSAATAGILLGLGVPAAVYLVAEFTERRKAMWRRLFEIIIPRKSMMANAD
jgi:peptidoglycan/LPS O-acetylase OafA/YrhL